jgi:transcriptional regulator with XRE-family HTH domain
MSSLVNFQQRLKYSLDKRFWTQRQLAEYCRVDEGLVSKWVNKIHKPSKEHLIMIGAALDCSPQWLRTGKGNKDDQFDIAMYSPQVEKKITCEKSPIGGYDFHIHITDEEMKGIIMTGVK